VVAHLAKLLAGGGERPAILSRGYGRKDSADGVVVVRDEEGVQAPLARAGDEPLMLARNLDGVRVVVAPDRYLAGRLAEMRLGCSVHLLDDGFQHLQLDRDIDLLVMHSDEFEDPQVLPFGTLREPLETAARADALLVSGDMSGTGKSIIDTLQLSRIYQMQRVLDVPRSTDSEKSPVPLSASSRILAIAGIAKPDRFFSEIGTFGGIVVRTLAFSDHHEFTQQDIVKITELVRALRIDLVLTTEKDYVRLERYQPFAFNVAIVPLKIEIEEEGEFLSWLTSQLAATREKRKQTDGAP
jgi:tetraacyldisaccharide 4'-kinase